MNCVISPPERTISNDIKVISLFEKNKSRHPGQNVRNFFSPFNKIMLLFPKTKFRVVVVVVSMLSLPLLLFVLYFIFIQFFFPAKCILGDDLTLAS